MWLKILIVFLLLVVSVNLFHALYTMMRSEQNSTHKMSHYLGRRLLFSALIIGLLVLAMATGVITPHQHPF